MRVSRLLRNRLLGTTRRLLEPAARWRASRAAPQVELAQVQRRLELLLGAMFGQPMRVVAQGSPAPRAPFDVVLPERLAAPLGMDDTIERYRLLAIEQGARIVRGSLQHRPSDPLERDLYALREGAAVDREIVRRAPRMAGVLARLRSAALTSRPPSHRLLPAERLVESLVQQTLRGELDLTPTAEHEDDANASLAWAREESARMRQLAGDGPFRYRGVSGIAFWGADSADDAPMTADDIPMFGILKSESSSRVEAPDGRDGQTTGDDAEAEGGPEAQAAPDGAGSDVHDASGEDHSGASPTMAASDADDSETAATGGIAYPEWLERLGRLVPGHTTVHATTAAQQDDAWAQEALREHAPLVRQLRDRFALLRARRLRLRAQRSGDELDLDACVNALIDTRLGRVPSERLYQMTRATRHTLAIVILVDVSGSTATHLPDGRTVLDVERLSLLLASEALDALGDPYAIHSFSGVGRHDVRIATVKAFGEHDRAAVHRRISSLEPQDNTRLGAAVRHATALLHAQTAGRKVLLILSDGRPNDVDRYQGSAAIEDSRQALLAARAGGAHSFCLTIDTDEADYLPHLFGEGGYRVISEPAQLPAALISLVDRLLRG